MIAVDGPAASGKGTVGKLVAESLGLEYLDTGAIYRAVAYQLLRRKIDLNNKEQATGIARNLTNNDMLNPDLYTSSVGKAASIISAIPEVREALFQMQRKVATNPKGAVLDGRDIGTVICPDADFKFYITADIGIRAERRYKQLQNQEISTIYQDVLEDLQVRDKRDSSRMVAPLIPAKDAIHIDTTHMNVQEVLEKILEIIAGRK